MGISFSALAIPCVFGFSVGIITALVALLILAGVGMSSFGLGGVTIPLTAGLALVATPLLALRWWLAWSLVVPITVLEGGGLRVSLRRSKSLTKGSRGRIFVVYALMIVLTWVVSGMLQVPFFLATGLHGLLAPQSVGLPVRVMQAMGAFISASLVGPLLTIALTLIYYDLRTRK